MISAIILAAGKAERMGGLKQLMPLGKSTIIGQTIDNFIKSKVDEVIVVIGHQADEVKKTIGDRKIKIVINTDYEKGMSTSLAAGLRAVNNKSEAFMLALADQPFVDSRTINMLIDEFTSCDKGIVRPVYEGKRGHPVVFSMKYKDELLKQKGDIGGREIIRRHPDDLLEVQVDSEGVCIDIDTMENYNASKISK